ncbi:unnamed protein product [Acanthoscelides obtectus]|uniref:DDE Tnp4 domain-containing protein n=1 Tax=Acanthoscelides obtectus TaxID=200917 RepID=A0A9P0KKM1_ACAOB|nr:unnamed protein product [Acanthoscelides obtectus]CAK1640030.1 hypothetical protein AOBTE_LOCUS11517 [Acanthoscelides obtectus]
MAIANANCEFIYCDVGTNGRISDGGVIANTTFYEKLANNDLKLPNPESMPNSNEILGYTFIADEAFAMRSDLIKPYSRKSPENYTPPESMDRENIPADSSLALGDRLPLPIRQERWLVEDFMDLLPILSQDNFTFGYR